MGNQRRKKSKTSSPILSVMMEMVKILVRKKEKRLSSWQTTLNKRGQALPIYMVLMFNLASWNIGGLNRLLKQKEVLNAISENNISLCAILESRVSVKRLKKICVNVFGTWNWISSGKLCNHVTRIIIGWDPNELDVMVLQQTTQVMRCQVTCKSNNLSFYCSFIYMLLMTIMYVENFGVI